MSATAELRPARVVTLVVVDENGTVLGSLDPFPVDTPWWMDVSPVVSQARRRYGVEVIVLRLLWSELAVPHGGAVTYLAQVVSGVSLPSLRSWGGELSPGPNRAAYAEVGGPQADLAWAEDVLRDQGTSPIGRWEQHRTWNLSSVWSLLTGTGRVWLKAGPTFFAHEGAAIVAIAAANRLSGGSITAVPTLLGEDRGRMLLAEIPGSDRYDAELGERLTMIDLLVDLQCQWLGRSDELVPLGLPDWRADVLSASIAELVERRAPEFDNELSHILAGFLDGLERRFSAIAACGMDDALVHGDFHPGNVRGDGTTVTLIDWADCGVGHPLLDQPAFLRTSSSNEIDPLTGHWAAKWRRSVPGCEPGRAAALLGPIAAARQAVVYQGFLDRIEATEQCYHRHDVPDWLERVAEILRRA